jgi:hypothetical protein
VLGPHVEHVLVLHEPHESLGLLSTCKGFFIALLRSRFTAGIHRKPLGRFNVNKCRELIEINCSPRSDRRTQAAFNKMSNTAPSK